MKFLPSIAALAIALSLAACSGKDDGNVTAPTGEPVAAVPAPAGTSWSETIATTPDGNFLMGNPSAKVKLVEFGSYTCSHCADFSAEASEEIRKMVDTGKLSFEFRPYVRDPIDLTTALLARCGGKDVVYPLSEQFFANQKAMFAAIEGKDALFQAANAAPPAQRSLMLAEGAGLIDFAKQRGISEDQAKQCLADLPAAEKLAADVEKANSEFAITGTPGFVINGSFVENSANWATLKPKLREAGVF
jgi:protein-disulfide isomerase